MDSLKKPEMILTIGNTLALIGVAVYGYNEFLKNRDAGREITKLFASMTARIEERATVKSLTELQTVIQTQFKKIEQRSRAFSDETNHLADQLELIQQQLDEIVKALNEQADVKIQLTKPPQKKKNNGGRRKVQYDDDDDDEGDDDDYTPPNRRNGNRRSASSSSNYGDDDIPTRRRN